MDYIVFVILGLTLILFIWGRWRYDVVACLALMGTVLCGVVPFAHAFSGFGNPAVVTVALVMIITRAISSSGVVDYMVHHLAPVTNWAWLHIAALTLIVAVLSAFMNNVGALALVMPIAIRTAITSDRSPSLMLMPIAFASILGGMTTLIGTPPNLLISAYRQEMVGQPFGMFSFSPVGVSVALLGILFIVLIGWRLIPKARLKQKASEDVFHIQDYVMEVLVPEASISVGKTLKEMAESANAEFLVVGMIRNKRKKFRLPNSSVLEANDILIVEASSKELEKLIAAGKLELVGDEQVSTETLRSKDIGLIEVVIVPGSKLEGRTPARLRFNRRYQISLLAISRQGKPFKERLRDLKLRAGDVLLLQGHADTLMETVVEMGFLPLAERELQIGQKKRAFLPIGIFALSLIFTVSAILPVQIAFAGAVLAMVLLDLIPIRRVYESIDWSVIVLLGAMIPVGGALQSTGGTQLIADGLVGVAGQTHPVIILGILMVVTMGLSDVINNVATAIVMAPIAASVAGTLGLRIDPFLMTVAVGASCAFLTPIGHQNNTLVMGPGGYHFGDYWRMGLPLELLILFVSLPLILWVWPLY